MDLPSLQAFLAVADSGSFSRAAGRLFLTQPAVSKRIAALEEELGAKLFDRIGRQVRLTEAGGALLPRARTILEAVEDTRRSLSNLSGKVEGTLRFGTSHHIGLHRLPPVLRTYSTAYPDVELDIHFMDSEAACQAVERGDLELGVVTLPNDPAPALTLTPVWTDRLSIVTAADHPLVTSGPASPAALARHPAILPARGTYTREIVEQAFARVGLSPNVSLSTNYLETIKMLVSVGLGWSVLPLSMVDEEVKAIPAKGLQPSRTLGVVEHGNRSLSNAAQALKALLQEHGVL